MQGRIIQTLGNFPSLEFAPELLRGELQKIPSKNKESAWNFSVNFCGFSGLQTCIVPISIILDHGENQGERVRLLQSLHVGVNRWFELLISHCRKY